MNFVKFVSTAHLVKTKTTIFAVLLVSSYLIGCSKQVPVPSAEQLAQFENAGPSRPIVDMDKLVRARIAKGAYKVARGDVLELTMPTILKIVTAKEPEITAELSPYVCRISDAGTITLPVIGEIDVAGKTLAEIELSVINAYHPEYTVTRPSVFARVLEYQTASVSISGAVNKPGIYSLRSDQMSLVALLMEAQGIIDQGAAFIRIIHDDPNTSDHITESIGNTKKSAKKTSEPTLIKPNQSMRITGHKTTQQRLASNVKLESVDPNEDSDVDNTLSSQPEQKHKNLIEERSEEEGSEITKHIISAKSPRPRSVVLPVEGFNIPFADVVLEDGDSVIVERLGEPMITVVGLVNKPGNYPYPPNIEYNVMHALGFAGGLNYAAEPHYATVYRLQEDGQTVSVTFNIIGIAKSKNPDYALSIHLKPYDVIAVEHTQRTRAMVFWDRAFRFNVGYYVRMEDLFGND